MAYRYIYIYLITIKFYSLFVNKLQGYLTPGSLKVDAKYQLHLFTQQSNSLVFLYLNYYFILNH